MGAADGPPGALPVGDTLTVFSQKSIIMPISSSRFGSKVSISGE